jgi:hypothetical protein
MNVPTGQADPIAPWTANDRQLPHGPEASMSVVATTPGELTVIFKKGVANTVAGRRRP